MFLLFKRILNLKVRLISILISFRQYTLMNEVQEAALTFKKTHHKQNQIKKKKITAAFRGFCGQSCCATQEHILDKKYYKFNLLNVNRKVREFIPQGKLV